MTKRRKRGHSAKRASNPTSMYLEWSGSRGQLEYYDKDDKEKKYLPKLSFVILDMFNSVGGFNNEKQSGIRGTEVRNIKTEKIQTYIDGKRGPKDYYTELKNSVNGLKFSKVLYITALKDGEPRGIIKLNLEGSSFGAFMDFQQADGDYEGGNSYDEQDLYNLVLSIDGKVKKKNGNTTYFEPIFNVEEEVDEELDEMIDPIFQKLDRYIQARSGNQTTSEDNSNDSEIRSSGTFKEKSDDSDSQDEQVNDEPDTNIADVGDLPF